jgi:hypothetical protein
MPSFRSPVPSRAILSPVGVAAAVLGKISQIETIAGFNQKERRTPAGLSCIFGFEDDGKGRLGRGECHVGICLMIRKRYQRSFLMNREHDKIKTRVILEIRL